MSCWFRWDVSKKQDGDIWVHLLLGLHIAYPDVYTCTNLTVVLQITFPGEIVSG